MIGERFPLRVRRSLLWVGGLALVTALSLPAGAVRASDLSLWLSADLRSEIFPESTHAGPIEGTPPAALVFEGRVPIGYLFATSDVVECLGFASSSFSIIAGIDLEGHLEGARLTRHHEPIIEGSVQQRVTAFIAQYEAIPYRRTWQVRPGGALADGEIDAISSATISSTLFNQAILRSARKVAQSRGLADDSRGIDVVRFEPASWSQLMADGSIAHLAVPAEGSVAHGPKPMAASHAESLIDLYVALATPARVGRNLLGDDNYELYVAALGAEDTALLVMANGTRSFIGSEVYKSGIFDRIRLQQRGQVFTLRRESHRHIAFLRAPEAPRFGEIALLRLGAESGFDPAAPFVFELAIRDGDAIPTPFTDHVTYRVPERYLLTQSQLAGADELWRPLWTATWRAQIVEISILAAALLALTVTLFTIPSLARRPRLYGALRIGFLLFTLGWLGWTAGAQLTIVTVLSGLQALRGRFSPDVFMLDPLNTLLMGFVVVTLFVWGRGVFCGWLCPFGAFQELAARVARFLGVRPLRLSHAVQRGLWPIKYLVLLGLVGLAFYSMQTALSASEIEPFETAIVLGLARDWPYLLYAGLLVGAGIFVERFYCRFLCPLGAVLALGGLARQLDGLGRHSRCGSPCRSCERRCPIQAIGPTGRINMTECLYCLDCQVLYHDEVGCPALATSRAGSGVLERGLPAAADRRLDEKTSDEGRLI
ncbi:MAG: hypothetical protein CL908_24985 [Deltaproteobacteria bacterium]|nr:hypothetical protein [Deltaproteobacteria bacterium]